jgi:hypothetical protein
MLGHVQSSPSSESTGYAGRRHRRYRAPTAAGTPMRDAARPMAGCPQRRHGQPVNRAVKAIIAGVAASGLLASILVVTITRSAATAGAGVPVGVAPGKPWEQWEQWDRRQVTNAAAIVSAGKSKQVPTWGSVVALATAMQESSLLNHANDNPAYPEVRRISMALPHDAVGHDHDSVGLFQQRPVEGDGHWGTVRELMTPSISAGKFYDALLQVDGWQQMRLTDAAQAVQYSVTPETYQKWYPSAKALALHVLRRPHGRVGTDHSRPAVPRHPAITEVRHSRR